MSSAQTKPNVSVEEARQMIEQKKTDPNFVLLDVRTALEHCISHINGSVNVSVLGIEGKLNELDKNKQYLVYCRSGARSNSAANTMRKNGFNNVSNMLGGMSQWDYDTTSSCLIM